MRKLEKVPNKSLARLRGLPRWSPVDIEKKTLADILGRVSVAPGHKGFRLNDNFSVSRDKGWFGEPVTKLKYRSKF